jgi:putative membrane protein
MVKVINFIKGFLMGICDIIPGISGGTIAFLTGIYQRLINSVKSFSFVLFYDLIIFLFSRKKSNVKKLKREIKDLDMGFLFTVLLGILTAIFLASRIILYLLESHYILTMSFFIGLIFASSIIIYSHIKNHNMTNIFIGLLGLGFIIIIMFFRPIEIESPGLFYIYIGGFIAIGAMFLPGISGAFILLIMGLYAHIIGYLSNLRESLSEIFVFAAGVITGAMFFSRFIHFLFEKSKCKTLYFLLGLVIGSLFIPLREIIVKVDRNTLDIGLSVLFFLFGLLLVIVVELLNKKKKNRMIEIEL